MDARQRRLIDVGLFAIFVTLTATAALGVISGDGFGRSANSAEASVKTAEEQGTGETRYSKAGYDITPLSKDRVEQLAVKLTDEEKQIILRKGTEPRFCGNLLDNKKQGTYLCRLCSLPLFSSDAKFDSGTGWPSFFQPYDVAHVAEEEDNSLGMRRVEILCARCDGHLGHVFPDGPPPTGRRYCLNSASLEFVEDGTEWPEAARPVETETAYFAGGCFWGVEHYFQGIPGVIDSVSGYQNGTVPNPTYKQVCTGQTGHAESVRVVFDPARVTYETLLAKFFKVHDPTQLNRQGPDIGTQYRSAIFTTSDAQLAAAKRFIEEQQREGRWSSRRIVTEVEPAETFYEAEEYHQDYAEKTGRQCHVIYE